MGTNYYLLNGNHIGKESAAGLYCWDCGITLCKKGEAFVHHSDKAWHDKCPECGKSHDKDSSNAAMRQLGFVDRSEPTKKKGVTSISSFGWAMEPNKLKSIRKVKDEYGREMSIKEFQATIDDWCPIQFYNNIGIEFS